MGYLADNFVIEEDEKLIKMLNERGYGTIDKNQRLVLSQLEALYLLEKKRIEVKDKGKSIKFNDLIKEFANREKDIEIKYTVYSDLREKGYILRTGYGFGTYFRAYEKGIRPSEGKSSILIEVMHEKDRISLREMERIVKLSQIIKKNLIIAIVNDEKKIKYMKINSIKL